MQPQVARLPASRDSQFLGGVFAAVSAVPNSSHQRGAGAANPPNQLAAALFQVFVLRLTIVPPR